METRTGMQTSEFKTTIGTQLLIALTYLANKIFGLNLELSEETALSLIGALTIFYTTGRSWVKGAAARAPVVVSPTGEPEREGA